jgi:hypothetical protein
MTSTVEEVEVERTGLFWMLRSSTADDMEVTGPLLLPSWIWVPYRFSFKLSETECCFALCQCSNVSG